jgi:hypothetical protein
MTELEGAGVSAANAAATGAGGPRWTGWLADRNRVLLAATAMGAVGIMLGGWFAGSGLVRMKEAERSVTVRGLAERDVTADLATWTLSYAASAGDLASAQTTAAANTNAVKAYFHDLGFPPSELTPAGVSVNSFNNNGVPTYTVQQRMQFRTTDIARAQQAVARQFDLVQRGVSLTEGSAMQYTFTGLNAIKPPMIALATRDARHAAEQFAKDSGASVGRIRQATQGYFEITARDGASENYGVTDTPNKRVRVVTTVEYYLD